jgi:hypothetical protein
MQACEGQVFGSGMQVMMVNGQAFRRGDKETTGQELGSNAVDFGVNTNGHVANVRASAHVLAVRNQVVGDQGEQFRTDRRGFGTGTFHKEAEGRLMDRRQNGARRSFTYSTADGGSLHKQRTG